MRARRRPFFFFFLFHCAFICSRRMAESKTGKKQRNNCHVSNGLFFYFLHSELMLLQRAMTGKIQLECKAPSPNKRTSVSFTALSISDEKSRRERLIMDSVWRSFLNAATSSASFYFSRKKQGSEYEQQKKRNDSMYKHTHTKRNTQNERERERTIII